MILLGCCALAQYLFTSEMVVGHDNIRIAAAGALIVAAVVLWSSGFLVMHKARTPIEPGDPPTSLVTGGPFRFSRNPLYVALLTVFISIALLANSYWFAGGALLLATVLNAVVIPAEERLLEAAFGEQFRSYRSRVRRWV